ncbi:hypothetical protein GCM10023093_31830 [Nemorincola caseinilytica]|uniref:Uncharacterized protein n=1 Tax=Nemorincola caseinilytica TaxID=2054315 RepID=A0ABP8NT45_9BACT
MRSFIRKILLFMLPVVLILLGCEWALRQIPNSYSIKYRYLQRNSDKLSNLVLGSSHTYFGIDPQYFSAPTFNAAEVSQSVDIDLKILKMFSYKELRFVILPVSYSSLFSKIEGGAEAWRLDNYAMYFPVEKGAFISFKTELFKDRLVNSLEKLRYYVKKDSAAMECSPLGWGIDHTDPAHVDTAMLRTTAIEAAKRHTSIATEADLRTSLLAENTATLEGIIKYCAGKGIRIIMVSIPVTDMYYSHLNSIQLQTTMTTLQAIDKRYDNCHYIDLSQSDRYGYSDFKDGDHLSRRGARKLSIYLDSTIQSMSAMGQTH